MSSNEIKYNPLYKNRSEILQFQSGGDINISCFFIDE
jgi:hypothetical protein